uniref:ubiquitinyl hydrolase 1 n=1 Tax=Pavo cristatus TaxID=9049 RepID=A0A8C9EME0_PAVCR
MSRKQAARARPGGPKKARRSRQPTGGTAPKPSEGGGGLVRQLRALGLKLREVPGDGNCLFRALGDQLEGHSRNHLRHRQETVEYMIKQREDFEPFVEDDVPFEKHVTNLAKPGTFAGNDAIVAFARNNQMNVVIHQLNAPLCAVSWEVVSGTMEIVYDETNMLSKNDSNKEEEMKQQKGDSEDEAEIEVEAAVQEVCSATGCSFLCRVCEKKLLLVGAEEQSEPQSKGQEQRASTPCEDNGSGSGTSGSQSLHHHETEDIKGQARSDEEGRANKNTKVFKKQKKEQQRLEKKKRQEERHRQKVLASRSNCADNSRREVDSDNQITLVKTMAALNI